MPRKPKLSDFCRELFIEGIKIQSLTGEAAAQLPDYNTQLQRVLGLMGAMEDRAVREGGYKPADVEEAKYALCAFLDEIIQFSHWPEARSWSSRPLQAQYFGEAEAGINFFQHLAQARRASREVCEVYYFCLMLGFKGQYRVAGAEQQLGEMLEDLRIQLGRGTRKRLSRHGRRPDDGGGEGRSFPMLPVAGLAVVVAIVVAAALYLILSMSSGTAVQILHRLSKGS